MATQPRMSAPIARVLITTRNKKRSSGDCWRAADPPAVEEVEAEENEGGPQPPRFYPFAPRDGDDER